MPYDPTTGTITPYVPEGQGYTPPSPATMQFPNAQLPPIFGEQIKLESGFPGVNPLTFDFQAEQQKAYTALKPFYDKLLSFTGGDLDLAKRILKYTYEQGTRETREEYEKKIAEQGLLFPKETEKLQTDQNRRGVLESGFGREDQRRLKESQGLRREAVERALKNRESRLGAEYGFGSEEAERGFEKDRFGLERQRRDEASGMAQDKFGIKQTIFGSQLAQAGLKENRDAQKKANAAFGNLGSESGILGSAKEYAESGRQSELDELRRQGKVNF